MEIDGRKSFLFFEEWEPAIKALPEKEQNALLWGIINAALHDDEATPEGVNESPMLGVLWNLIAPSIKRGVTLWRNGCKGAEFGKLGGAPQGNQNARKYPKSESDAEREEQPQDNPKTNPKGGKGREFSNTDFVPIWNAYAVGANSRGNLQRTSSKSEFLNEYQGHFISKHKSNSLERFAQLCEFCALSLPKPLKAQKYGDGCKVDYMAFWHYVSEVDLCVPKDWAHP